MAAKIIAFEKPASKASDGMVYVGRGEDGFYTIYVDASPDAGEIIMGGPYALESNAQIEAKELAADFGVRLLHRGWGTNNASKS